MKVPWQTRWLGQEIVVYHHEVEVDRIDVCAIERVLLLYDHAGDSPGDVVQAVVELADECAVFGAETGFAGRVNFERLAFWSERRCVHWVSHARARLPLRLRTGIAFVRPSPPAFVRVPRAELAPWIARWPLQGPQTWDERKRRRIARPRPFVLEQA